MQIHVTFFPYSTFCGKIVAEVLSGFIGVSKSAEIDVWLANAAPEDLRRIHYCCCASEKDFHAYSDTPHAFVDSGELSSGIIHEAKIIFRNIWAVARWLSHMNLIGKLFNDSLTTFFLQIYPYIVPVYDGFLQPSKYLTTRSEMRYVRFSFAANGGCA